MASVVLYWLDDYEQAIRQFNEYLKIVAEMPTPSFLGYSYLYSGQMEEALKWIEILKKLRTTGRVGFPLISFSMP